MDHFPGSSTNRLSMYRTSPARRVEIIPFELIKPSASLRMVQDAYVLRCLPVVDMGQDADVSYVGRVVLQFLDNG